MNTFGEILDAYKIGAITRDEAVSWIENIVTVAIATAKIAMIDRFRVDVAEVFEATKPGRK